MYACKICDQLVIQVKPIKNELRSIMEKLDIQLNNSADDAEFKELPASQWICEKCEESLRIQNDLKMHEESTAQILQMQMENKKLRNIIVSEMQQNDIKDTIPLDGKEIKNYIKTETEEKSTLLLGSTIANAMNYGTIQNYSNQLVTNSSQLNEELEQQVATNKSSSSCLKSSTSFASIKSENNSNIMYDILAENMTLDQKLLPKETAADCVLTLATTQTIKEESDSSSPHQLQTTSCCSSFSYNNSNAYELNSADLTLKKSNDKKFILNNAASQYSSAENGFNIPLKQENQKDEADYYDCKLCTDSSDKFTPHHNCPRHIRKCDDQTAAADDSQNDHNLITEEALLSQGFIIYELNEEENIAKMKAEPDDNMVLSNETKHLDVSKQNVSKNINCVDTVSETNSCNELIPLAGDANNECSQILKDDEQLSEESELLQLQSPQQNTTNKKQISDSCIKSVEYNKFYKHMANKYYCMLCKTSKKYKYHGGVISHINTMHLDVKYKCNECNVMYTAYHDMRQHYENQHKLKQIPLPKEITVMVLPTSSNADKIINNKRSHYDTLMGETGGLYSCNICAESDKPFTSKYDASIRRHIKVYHLEAYLEQEHKKKLMPKPIPPSRISNKQKRKQAAAARQTTGYNRKSFVTLMGKSGNQYVCSICARSGKSYTSEHHETVRRHIKLLHQEAYQKQQQKMKLLAIKQEKQHIAAECIAKDISEAKKSSNIVYSFRTLMQKSGNLYTCLPCSENGNIFSKKCYETLRMHIKSLHSDRLQKKAAVEKQNVDSNRYSFRKLMRKSGSRYTCSTCADDGMVYTRKCYETMRLHIKDCHKEACLQEQQQQKKKRLQGPSAASRLLRNSRRRNRNRAIKQEQHHAAAKLIAEAIPNATAIVNDIIKEEIQLTEYKFDEQHNSVLTEGTVALKEFEFSSMTAGKEKPSCSLTKPNTAVNDADIIDSSAKKHKSNIKTIVSKPSDYQRHKLANANDDNDGNKSDSSSACSSFENNCSVAATSLASSVANNEQMLENALSFEQPEQDCVSLQESLNKSLQENPCTKSIEYSKYYRQVAYKYYCMLCTNSKTYTYHSGVAGHIKTAHIGQKYKCTDCTAIYTSYTRLRKHYQRQHKSTQIPLAKDITIFEQSPTITQTANNEKDNFQTLMQKTGNMYSCITCAEAGITYAKKCYASVRRHIKVRHLKHKLNKNSSKKTTANRSVSSISSNKAIKQEQQQLDTADISIETDVIDKIIKEENQLTEYRFDEQENSVLTEAGVALNDF